MLYYTITILYYTRLYCYTIYHTILYELGLRKLVEKRQQLFQARLLAETGLLKGLFFFLNLLIRNGVTGVHGRAMMGPWAFWAVFSFCLLIAGQDTRPCPMIIQPA